nr:hypothetical protein [Tanacetum cinerariifolium]
MTNNTIVTTSVNVTRATVTNTVANHAKKPIKFDRQNFKRWQQKMFFYFTTLNLAQFLKEPAPQFKTEDAGTKKFVVAHFVDYKKVDTKNVITQVQDLQVLLHDIHAEGMPLRETFQVAAIIEKLPPSLVEFKNYLRHKRKEMSVEDLVVRLRHRAANCKMPNRVTPHHANMVNDNVDMIGMVSDVIVMISEVNM